MLNLADTPVRSIVKEADRQATAARSPAVEAEHLLLAVATTPGTPAYDVLIDAGLTTDAIGAALHLNVTRSLAAAGVTWDGSVLGVGPVSASPKRRPAGRTTFGASARLALTRATKVAKGRKDARLSAGCVLVGVLLAEVGTVPRLLAAAGVDRVALLAAALVALPEPA